MATTRKHSINTPSLLAIGELLGIMGSYLETDSVLQTTDRELDDLITLSEEQQHEIDRMIWNISQSSLMTWTETITKDGKTHRDHIDYVALSRFVIALCRHINNR